jgi:hypothetical protein
MAETTESYAHLKTIQKGSYAELTEDQRQQAQWRPGLCEVHGGHVVERPRIWPPRQRSQSKRGKDYASVPCTKCGANVIIYDPLQDGVRWADDKRGVKPGA